MRPKSQIRTRAVPFTGMAAISAAALALSGCATGPKAVGFDEAQSATIQIEAQGTFVSAGTTEAAESAGRGSGFLIDPSGIAVTNNHVVTGAGTLKVWQGGDTSKQLNAKVLGASECLDLAVIQLDEGDYPFLDWHEGDIANALEVYSLGYPLGDPEFTTTKGIVSKADVNRADSWADLDHVIEHDARIRGGNSGGPLVDAEGTVVGVNYAGDDVNDQNFAIHRDEALKVIDDLKAGTPVLSLGVNATALPPSDAGEPQGIWVESVQAGGAADKAGIQPGDVLANMAGVTLGEEGTLEGYCQVLETQGVDSAIDVTVVRPSDGTIHEGQFNGTPLEQVSVPSEPVPSQSQTVGEFVTVTDDSGIVSVQLPDTWSEVDGSSFETEDGQTVYDIVASTDLEAFRDNWDISGVEVSAVAAGTDPDEVLASLKELPNAECTLNNEGEYDDGMYVGEFSYWTDCGGIPTDYAVIVGMDEDETHVIAVRVQMATEIDQTAVYEKIKETFMAQI